MDIGGSPTIYVTDDDHRVVGIGSKSGSLLDAHTMQPLARRQLLPYGPGNKPLASINNDSGDYGIFGTAAVHTSLKRLFVGVGGDPISDSNEHPLR